MNESFPWQKLLCKRRKGKSLQQKLSMARKKKLLNMNLWKRPQSINLILQIANILANLHNMQVIQSVPFPSPSATRTPLGQRVWHCHRHVTCHRHSWCSLGQLLHIRFCHSCTEKRKSLIYWLICCHSSTICLHSYRDRKRLQMENMRPNDVNHFFEHSPWLVPQDDILFNDGRDRRICTTVDLWLFCMEQRDLRD